MRRFNTLLIIFCVFVGCSQYTPRFRSERPASERTVPERKSDVLRIPEKGLRDFERPSMRRVRSSLTRENRIITGWASFYGSDFHGKRTANGEIYNMYGLTAAHKTLPLGTRVRVINLSNKKTVEVKINDRGPYVKDRILDLSYGAALKLDMVSRGLDQVKIIILKLGDGVYHN